MRAIRLLLVTAAFLTSLNTTAQRPVSTVTSGSYSKKTGLTTYSVLPFGSVAFPGKWRKAYYYHISRQQNFIQGDSLKTAISINMASRYPFYKQEFSENRMAREMYEWDSQYLVERAGGERVIVKDDTVNHFIVWKLTAGSDRPRGAPIYLFGSQRGIIYNLSIVTDRWDEDRKLRFLEDMYRSRTPGTCCP